MNFLFRFFFPRWKRGKKSSPTSPFAPILRRQEWERKGELTLFYSQIFLIAKERCRGWKKKKKARVKKKMNGENQLPREMQKDAGAAVHHPREGGVRSQLIWAFLRREPSLLNMLMKHPRPPATTKVGGIFCKSCKKIMIIKTGDIKLKKGQCLVLYHIMWLEWGGGRGKAVMMVCWLQIK